MFFLCYYTQINPKINPYGIKFATKGAVCNTLRLMWAIGIGSTGHRTKRIKRYIE